MPSKRKGSGSVADLTIEILKDIRQEIRGTNERMDKGFAHLSERLDQTNSRLDQTNSRLDQTNSRLDQTNSRLDQVAHGLDQVNVRLDQVTARLENIRDLAGDRYRDHEERICKLEQRLP